MSLSDFEELSAPPAPLFFIFDDSRSNFDCFSRVQSGDDVPFLFSSPGEDILPQELTESGAEWQRSEADAQVSESQAKRADNTIFKSGLGEYRKSLIDETKSDPRLGWLPAEVKKIYGAKNLSVFPKLNIMVRQLGIDHEIWLRWVRRSSNLLARKQQLVRRGRYSQFRYQELERSIAAMNLCMNQPVFEKGFQEYWGKFKQSSRHAKSREEVLSFRQYFKGLLKERSIHVKIGLATDRNSSGIISLDN